ncbi:hypothetical protein HDU98_008259 [Podochytrium sp. JEL0797]|nr:hypothetical protein HDU98_008259 [Podochytrium sp. JEL0797]
MSDDYVFQLAQVEEALLKDPENDDLQRLQKDLTDLIDLMGMQAPAPTSSHHDDTPAAVKKPKRRFEDPEETAALPDVRWVKGQTVLAKYHKDGKMYEAVVDSVPTSTAAHYAVVFKGYTSKEKVVPEDVRDFDPTQVAKPLAAVSGGAKNKRTSVPKAVVAAFSNGTDRSTKRKLNNQLYHEAIQQKETEQSSKQNAWQKFAKGGKKASLKTQPPLNKTSMFATPEDPNAKVGVVGSGKGMTNFQQRGKHVYDRVE